ncbi:DUF488 domain-containing protein [Yersinia enterocolitica]|uniref:DUF488 domain-containing protein n=1 Tax=Yersinia enterocolitica TaxID=630 RepID=UPI0005DE5D78|nr:DUF488 domain-containing protein [Yersinia enterocolitica]EKN3528343.1 DUF488 domain-containing protein [Yersinia enterocolitica]ELI8305217.1 DUF488 domain-containing protein [Yersinia enterocolitica]CFQ70358.1 Uncharacterized conserved protein [Yersinia enterocolitica]HDL7098830.1 DUF488 domain-containing protein [Yersinia enterocolitica]HDM8091970.1 DUF488 domain-containing protein [Yersinia enterocolitica]
MKIYSIGFTEKTAEKFFTLIKSQSDIKNLVDVRLNNVSQLAGFAKKNDLKYFLKELCNVNYVHVPELAPTKEMLNPYKKGNISWEVYEDNFLNLMAKRNIERIDKSLIEYGCLLCSEHKPHHCHRRLVIEYLNNHWDTDFEVRHLI